MTTVPATAYLGLPRLRGWRGRIGAASALAVLAVIERQRRARRVAQAKSGVGPGVRTDDGVLLHTQIDGPSDASVTVIFARAAAPHIADPALAADEGSTNGEATDGTQS